MKFLEQDLETIIYNADNKALNEKGLPIEGKKLRQLRIGNYGVADLVTARRCKNLNGFNYLSIEVYELKKDEINMDAYLQAIRYARGIQRYFQERFFNLSFDIGITLIGSKVKNTNGLIYLNDLFYTDSEDIMTGGLSSIRAFTYSYEFDGIYFEQEYDYHASNEGFNL